MKIGYNFCCVEGTCANYMSQTFYKSTELGNQVSGVLDVALVVWNNFLSLRFPSLHGNHIPCAANLPGGAEAHVN